MFQTKYGFCEKESVCWKAAHQTSAWYSTRIRVGSLFTKSYLKQVSKKIHVCFEAVPWNHFYEDRTGEYDLFNPILHGFYRVFLEEVITPLLSSEKYLFKKKPDMIISYPKTIQKDDSLISYAQAFEYSRIHCLTYTTMHYCLSAVKSLNFVSMFHLNFTCLV